MAKSAANPDVTMRVRIGESEIEVTGPADFVEKRIAEFVARSSSPVTQKSSTHSAPSHKPQDHPIKGKSQSPAQFFQQLNPKTDVDRALIAGYFIEKVLGQENFTSQEVRDLIRRAKRQPPPNVSDAVAKNIKKGLVMTAGKQKR